MQGGEHAVDFARWLQFNTRSNFKRRIRRVDTSTGPTCPVIK